MKKRFYAYALVTMAALHAPQAANAAVYAAHLKMTANLDGTYALSYRLNEDANQGVTINIKGAGNVIVRTITGNPTAKGAHTVQWDGKDSSSVVVPNGTYTWEVVASTNNPGSSYTRVDLGDPMQTRFGIPYALAIDKNTTSPHFGNIYVGNRGPATNTPPRPTETGVYVLGNDLSDITGQGDTAYKGGSGANLQYPWEITVAPTSEVFIADYIDANSNVFVMDPNNMTGNFSRLFDDTGRDATGLNATNGSVYGMYIEGSGEDMTLYTLDEDFGGDTKQGSAWAYNIGTVRSGYSAAPTNLYDDAANGNAIINYSGEIHKDTNPNRTGWFLSQTRDNETATNPNYLHFNGTAIDWKSQVDFNFYLNQNYYASFDLNSDSTRMVAAGFKWVQVLDISNLQGMTESSIIYTDTGANTVHRDIRFDPVENFYLAANTTELIYYYSKQGANTYTTPNPVGSDIVIGPSNVEGWELY